MATFLVHNNLCKQFGGHNINDFPRHDSGLNINPFPILKWAKTSQNGVYHSQFLCSKLWWKFYLNPNINSKVTDAWKFALNCEWMHVFIHIFMQIFKSFFEGQLKQQSLVTVLFEINLESVWLDIFATCFINSIVQEQECYYHMTLKWLLKLLFWHEKVKMLPLCMQLLISLHNVTE